MARGDWNEVGREREKVPPPIPADKRRLGQEERRLAIRPGSRISDASAREAAQLVKNIIAESERVIEFGEHASIHTSRQSCSKAGKARIFALVWGVIQGIPVHTGIDRIGWSGADRPLLAMGTRPQGEGSP
jgi:hypothetical protein